MKVAILLGIAYVLSATYAQDSTFDIICNSNPLMTKQVENLHKKVDSVSQNVNNMTGQVDQVQLLLENQTKDLKVDKLANTKQVDNLHNEVDSVAQTVNTVKGQVDQVQLLLENQAKDFKVEVDKLARMLEKVIENKAATIIWRPLTTGTYAFLGEPRTWYEANDKCKEIGGYLVEINSQEEQDLVVRISHALGWKELKLAFWLGLIDGGKPTRKKTKGTWVWERSQRRMYDGFMYWMPRQKNDNEPDHAHCALATGTTYGWHKSPCDTKTKLGSDWAPATVCKRDG
eukprot:GFUD01038141.1.p1 GENE.GFUD01038141.1~~GFUD01038141.1.p1  ORF type:complete len:287 (-),score=58.68 GFUD01038141.1:93-953(-)